MGLQGYFFMIKIISTHIARYYFFLFLIMLLPNYSFCQPVKEQQFIKAVKDITLKMSTSDSSGLSKYVQPGIGVYLIYKMGINNSFKNFKTVSFTDSSYPNLLFFHAEIKIDRLRYSSLPVYNCDDNTWSKKGAFTDTTKVDHLLSKTAKLLKREGGVNISNKAISNFKLLESKSRRVIITSDDGNDFIFYVSYINKKWLLTIVDMATTDCSV